MWLAAVKAGDIFEVIWVSMAAGVFVSIAYSFVVLGMARSTEARRTGATTSATAYAGLAIVCFALFALAVGFGVHIILSKS